MKQVAAYSLLLSALVFAVLTISSQIAQPPDIPSARRRLTRTLLYSVLMTIALGAGLTTLFPDTAISFLLVFLPICLTFFILQYAIGLLFLRRRSRRHPHDSTVNSSPSQTTPDGNHHT